MASNTLAGIVLASLTLLGCNRAEVQHANNICACFESTLALDASEMRAAIASCNTKSRVIKAEYKDNPSGSQAIKSATKACMKPLHAKMATLSQEAKKNASMPRTAVKKSRKARKKGGEQ